MNELFNEGNHDFYYVSLVSDKSPTALARVNEFNLFANPTVFFDGGYEVDVGAGSIPSAKAAFDASLTSSEARAVKDIDIELDTKWATGTSMVVCATVTNNEAALYEGHIRVYVTEFESSHGWFDTAGLLYKYPLLSYVMDQDIDVPANDSWALCLNWDGTSQGYPNVTYDNVLIIATVSDRTVHQGYANPPTGNPFNAFYPDQTVAGRPKLFTADTEFVSQLGDQVNFSLWGRGENAGRNYMILGSVTGSVPGTPLPGGMATMPMNWDIFTNIVISLANSVLFPNFLGTLAGDGTASATFNLPAVPGAAGITMTFAYALNSPWNVASNPVNVTIQ